MDSSFAAKYLSENLTVKHFGDGTDRIGETLYNSKISLNPHQIQAALFAFASPVSKGVMLCDEVGLGKTIEAGIVISQYWCERKRNIIVITPASLTRQWASELEEKFSLPSVVVDKKYYNAEIRKGVINPFEVKNKILIMSINFASNMHDEIKHSKIDLVVIDEVHKLRNVFSPSNVMANNIKGAIGSFKKVLLTATPLQNNLMELYGLSLLIDENIFGDKEYYKRHFIKEYDINKLELRDRLSSYIHRTLRNQVQKYVKYSKRITHTFTFTPSEEEDLLYDKITDLIHSNPTFGTLKGQSWLISMILRKLLSSSTSAVISTLETIKKRLTDLLAGKEVDDTELFEDEEAELEEISSDEECSDERDLSKAKDELAQINDCLSIAYTIKDDRKAMKLLEALKFLFENVKEGREKKILIFTESRRTQDYLFDFLLKHGYSNTVLFNGGNTDPKTKDIYNEWIEKPENAVLSKNSKSTNIRTALLDYFKNTADIMIATEAGAEGLNIQFCSMMINYDLPWNPQRVEQRIGRCHRFGQKNDVIVINFLNKHNQIDGRIYQLLQEKFKLFDDVFGSSDEVLGKLDSETNFEREIFEIYNKCRTPAEIDQAFDELQAKYKSDISAEMKKTRELLIDNFDEDLQQIFDSLLEDAKVKIKDIEDNFWRLCKYCLGNNALFFDYVFYLKYKFGKIKPGKYIVADADRDRINIHYNDSLGEQIVNACKETKLGDSAIFDLTSYKYQIQELKELVGKKGIVSFGKVVIDSFEKEEYFILSGRLEDGTYLDQETISKLFRLDSRDGTKLEFRGEALDLLHADFETSVKAAANRSIEKNNAILKEEIKKIDDWANDKIAGIELQVEILREQRKGLQKDADYTTNSVEKIKIEQEIEKISKRIKKLWLELADNEDVVDRKRKTIIQKLKAESMKKISTEHIFDMPFEVI